MLMGKYREDAQKGCSVRPQQANRRGGTYRTSCEPFTHRIDLGERISAISVILLHGRGL